MDKLFAFDYMLSLFEQWCDEESKGQGSFKNSSKLSVLKLLFLTAAVPKEKNGDDILNTFDKFYALPYGPVESDVYNNIQRDELPSYRITERSIVKKTIYKLPYDVEDYKGIKDAVDALKNKNKKLILSDAFKLVEITHRWESWKSSYGFAQLIGAQSYEMSAESIRNDKSKCFSLY